jgi:hypothetical protein
LTIVPTVEAVGAAFPQGCAIISHCVSVPPAVQLKVADVPKTTVDANEKGAGHTGGAAQVTLATHPAAVVVALLRKRNVKHPSGLEEVNEPGFVVPQYAPGNPPGTAPAPLALAICGAAVEFPLKIYNPSLVASILKLVNVTVTACPVTVGQIVTV